MTDIETALKTLQDLPCPECVDGSGGIQVSETEVVRCRWCDEREQALSVIRQYRLQPIATAPRNKPVLATDGKWSAVVIMNDEVSQRAWIHHWAVSQELDWEPTQWAPIPWVKYGTA